MARVIDADELNEKLERVEHESKLRSAILPYILHTYVYPIIERLPAIDAEPVRHGHWIDCADFEQCSECKGTQLKTINTIYGAATWMKTDYCPNCGAKMDGGKDDERRSY